MKSTVCTVILLTLCGAFLVLFEMVMQPWRPMFFLILVSFSIALAVAYFAFRKSELWSGSRRQAVILASISVFIFFTVWSLLWAISEEGLIHYYLSTYGQDDTGGRYFYPGNSGMGYARGLSNPLNLMVDILMRAVGFGLLLGLPLGFILTAKKDNSEQGAAANP